jgi:hypothetical protein
MPNNSVQALKGNKIDKLLVEGKDIFSDQHQTLMEGIKTTDVKQIKIIQHYKTNAEQLLLGQTDRTAINVMLTDSAKMAWNGTLNVAIGHPKRYQLATNAYTASEKLGIRLFGRFNNTGQNTLSTDEFLATYTSTRSIFQNMQSTVGGFQSIDQLVPHILTGTQTAIRASSGMISGNIDYQPSSKVHLKTSLLALQVQRTERDSCHRQYNTYPTLSIFKGTDTTDTQYRLLQLGTLAEVQLHPKLLLSVEYPITLQTNNTTTHTQGVFNNTPAQYNNVLAYTQLVTSPSISFAHKIADSLTTSYSYTYDYHDKPQITKVQGATRLFNTPLTDLVQQPQNTRQTHTTEVKTKYLKHSWHILNKLTTQHTKNQLNIKTTPFQPIYNTPDTFRLQGTARAHLHTYQNSLSFHYFGKKWQINLENTLQLVHSKLNNSTYTSKLLTLPHATLAYKLSAPSTLFLHFSTRNTAANPYSSPLLYTITNAYTVQTDAVQLGTHTATQTATFMYEHIHLAKQIILMSSLNYTYHKTPIYPISTLQNQYTLTQPLIVPYTRQYSTFLYLDKNWTKPKIQFNLMHQAGWLQYPNNQPALPQNNRYTHNNISITYAQNKNIDISFYTNISYENLTYTQSDLQTHLYAIQPSLRIKYYLKKLSFNVNPTFSYQKTNKNKPNLFSNIYSEIAYKKTNFKYYITIYNVFRSNSTPTVTSAFNTTFAETRYSTRLPGFILVGFEYKY